MRQLHETYTPNFLSQLVRETAPRAKAAEGLPAAPSAKLAQAVREMVVAIPWGHHVNLLAKIEQPAQRLYYLQATARVGGSRNTTELRVCATPGRASCATWLSGVVLDAVTAEKARKFSRRAGTLTA